MWNKNVYFFKNPSSLFETLLERFPAVTKTQVTLRLIDRYVRWIHICCDIFDVCSYGDFNDMTLTHYMDNQTT